MNGGTGKSFCAVYLYVQLLNRAGLTKCRQCCGVAKTRVRVRPRVRVRVRVRVGVRVRVRVRVESLFQLVRMETCFSLT